jgi:7-cyano-7-deazaguanine synthase
MSKPSNVLVLLSGGQDSTTCLFWARERFSLARIHALTMTYGQRHESEVAAAVDIAKMAGCASHRVVDLSAAMDSSDSALLMRNADRAITADGGMVDHAVDGGLPTSFVPGRNLVFLAVAGAHAAAIGAQRIVTGVCQTDYSGYPDCRKQFLVAMEAAINEAMPTEVRPIKIDAPLMDMSKADTVQMAINMAGREIQEVLEIARPRSWKWAGVWRALGRAVTCYHGHRPGCGECPACVLRVKGFAECGVGDPQFDDS